MRINDFEMGDVVMTCGIARLCEEKGKKFTEAVHNSFRRYVRKDWGELDDEDIQMNDNAFKSGEDRIFASYETEFGKIWIITEWDRSVTTILLPEEY